MGLSYSTDLRDRVVGFVETGHSRRHAARHFGVSESCALRLLQRWRSTGSTAPARQGRPPGGGKLAAVLDFLISRVEAKPDITMPELAGVLERVRGVKAHPASVSKVLCKAGLTYKKTADGVGVRTRRHPRETP